MKVKDKQSPEGNTQEEKHERKPFNKKEWRRKKYSNKYKVEQWEQRRRKAVLHHYYKELRKDARTGNQNLHVNKETNSSVPKPTKQSAYKEAQEEYERKQAEKKANWEAARRKKQEMAEALAKYKKNKMERYKKLSKRTKKGQPVMKDRIELLLQKLQENK